MSCYICNNTDAIVNNGAIVAMVPLCALTGSRHKYIAINAGMTFRNNKI